MYDSIDRNIKSKFTHKDIAVDYMFAICCEESARHFVQAVGFNAEMLVPWAKGFFQDTKLPLKLLEL